MSEYRYDHREIEQRLRLGQFVTEDEAAAVMERRSIEAAAGQDFDFGAIEAAKVGGEIERNFIVAQQKHFADQNPNRRW